MTDIVERLKGPSSVTAYDAAGRVVTYDAYPSPIMLEAAATILSLRLKLEELEANRRRMREWATAFREVITDPDELANFNSVWGGE